MIKKNLIEIDKVELIRLIDYEYFDKNKKNTIKTKREHDYNLKFQSIQQKKNETLKDYYKRTIELFKKFDDKNVSIVKSLNIFIERHKHNDCMNCVWFLSTDRSKTLMCAMSRH